jgi:predicted DNA-binding transcriptional regulator AlpA
LTEQLIPPNAALAQCEELELEHPEWHVTYAAPGDHRWSREGFYAIRKAAWRPEPDLYGADATELEAALLAWKPPPTYGIRLVRTDEVDLTGSHNFPKLLGTPEISERIGCNQEAVEEIARSDSFPPPAATLAQGSVWLTSDVENWIRTHRPDLRGWPVAKANFSSR